MFKVKNPTIDPQMLADYLFQTKPTERLREVLKELYNICVYCTETAEAANMQPEAYKEWVRAGDTVLIAISTIKPISKKERC